MLKENPLKKESDLSLGMLDRSTSSRDIPEEYIRCRGPNVISGNFPSIPGFDPIAKLNKPNDENLAPLDSNHVQTIQYGQNNFLSIQTDDPLWSPGVCLNLQKYEGIFRVKSTGIHQQVDYFIHIQLLKRCC